ncbi:MAG: FAD-dependent oxidoreductase [Acidobacteriota bacterium]
MTVRIVVDGQEVEVDGGTSVASAVFDLGVGRTSLGGDKRQALCGMGVCFECRLTVDGEPNRRTCQLPVREGLRVSTPGGPADAAPRPDPAAGCGESSATPAPLAVDVAVVGGGPAGMAAAVTAGEAGRSVAVVDDNPGFGGQIWRASRGGGDRPGPGRQTREAAWFRRFRAVVDAGRLTPMGASSLVDAAARPGGGAALTVRTPAGVRPVDARSLVLATGARELFLPFPGWTRPGVLGAGGLQAMIKAGLDVGGRRIVVAGSGPLLLAVADLARRRGGEVVRVVEQASAAAVARFGAGLLRRPGTLAQAAGLAFSLRRVPKTRGAWPTEARGTGRLEAVVLSNGEILECDLLACGFGLLPDIGVARHLGLAADNDDGVPSRGPGPWAGVPVDHLQRTRRAGIYAAGECTGVGGVAAALVEGQIAGRAAAGLDPDPRLDRRRRRAHAFARALEAAFRLDPRLRDLPAADTVVCRCEDVPWRRLSAYGPDDGRRAKLETRCGMGPCQGRICGGALSHLLGFAPDLVRPPFFPTPVADLMSPADPTSPTP